MGERLAFVTIVGAACEDTRRLLVVPMCVLGAFLMAVAYPALG